MLALVFVSAGAMAAELVASAPADPISFSNLDFALGSEPNVPLLPNGTGVATIYLGVSQGYNADRDRYTALLRAANILNPGYTRQLYVAWHADSPIRQKEANS
jgi:hypothetical protein